MAYRYATNEAGERVRFRSATDGQGNTQWFPAPEETINVAGDELPYPSQPSNVGPGRSAAAPGKAKALQRKNTRYLRDVYETRGPAAYERAAEAQDMGFLEKAPIVAGRETDKLLAGTGDIADFFASLVGDSGAYKRTTERAKEQSGLDEVYQELSENAGLADIAGMAPYLVSGTLAGPASRLLSDKAIKGVATVANTGATAGRGLVTRGVDRMASSNAPIIGTTGRKIKREIMDPMQRESMRSGKQLKEVDYYREGLMQDILAGGALGAAEGGIRHGDETNFIEGAISGLAGTSGGKFIEPAFRRSPVHWDEVEQANVDWAEDQGMKLLPGMKTGSLSQQKFEAGLRSEDDFADYLSDFDRNNSIVMSRKAAEAAGMPVDSKTPFSPENLRKHSKSLSDQYEHLSSVSIGRLKPDQVRGLSEFVQGLKANTAPSGKKVSKAVESYVSQIAKMSKIGRNQRGRLTKATFDGKEYQRIRRDLVAERNKAFEKSDRMMSDALTPLIDMLDEGMERGVADFGGQATAAKWKDLNERYAMTKLIMNHGMTATNKFDPRKLGNHLMSTDAQRTLMEQGGRIKDLQKLVKVDEMMRNQAGSGLSGSNVHPFKNPGRKSVMQALVGSRVGNRIPLLPSLYMNLYKKGIPSTRGLLSLIPNPTPFKIMGLTGKNAGDISRYTRAAAMGTKAHNEAIDSIDQILQYGEGHYNNLMDYLEGNEEERK